MFLKKVYIYLFEGFSDWEIAYLTPEIIKSDEYEIVYFSEDGAPLQSMGGLRIMPGASLASVLADDVAMLILPGGTAWGENKNRELDVLIKKLYSQNKPVAAICGATVYLARLGFFADVKHTSNALEYLKWIFPEYKDEANYVDSPAVIGGNVITASGIAPIEFAYEVFKKLNLKSEEELEKWFRLFKHGIYN